jgi:protein disulfide-isomerase
LPPQLAQQNKALAGKYGIKGFPTILFLDEGGNVLGRSGYLQGGAQAWIQSAQGIISARAGAKPETGLARALERARKDGLPLLAVVGGNSLKDEDFKPFYRSPELANLLDLGVVLVRVPMPAAADATADDAKATEALAARAGSKGPELRFVLLDASGEKALYNSTATAPDAKALVPALVKALPALAYNGEWLESVPRAMLVAAQKNRPLLLDFTGSDWCGWCIKLDKEVLSTDEFKAYAREKLVLVKLDFPKRREQPERTKQQNRTLMEKYGVEGFPTLIVVDAGGQKLGTLGYVEGGPAAFLAKLKELVK